MVFLEPADMILVFGVQTAHQIPKCLPVVVMDQMADLVNDDVIDDLVGGHDQFAVEIEIIFAGTASPDTGNLFQDDPVVGHTQEFGEMTYFLGDDPLAVVEIPADHRLFEFFSLGQRGVVSGDFDFEFVVKKG